MVGADGALRGHPDRSVHPIDKHIPGDTRVCRPRHPGSAGRMLLYLLLLALSGLVVGALARLALPGPDPMGLGMTMLVGIAGSLAAGLITYAIFGRGHGAGFILSVLCAMGIVWLIRRSRERQGVGGPPRRRLL